MSLKRLMLFEPFFFKLFTSRPVVSVHCGFIDNLHLFKYL